MNHNNIDYYRESNGDFIVVQDFTERSTALREGYITQEEVDAAFGKEDRNGKFNTEDGIKFLEEYGDLIPFFCGGSNGGTVEGHNRHESAAFLQQKMLGNVEEALMPSTQDNFDYGHIFEEPIAQKCAKMLRQKEGMDVVYIPCEYGYVNPTSCLVFLAHPDGFLLDRKTRKVVALVEVKTAQANSEEWQCFCTGQVPEGYQDQVQPYMKTLGIDGCYFFVHNKCGSASENFKYVYQPYEAAHAEKVLRDIEKFVYDTAAGILWDPETLHNDEAARVYREEDPSLGLVKLPKKTLGTLEKIDRIRKDKEALNDDIKETNKLIRQKEAEEKKLRESLIPYIGHAPGGYIETEKATFTVDVTRGYGIDKDVKQKAAEEFPEAWETISGYKPTISCKVTSTPKETEEEAG